MKALLLIATVVAAITTAAPAFGDTFITDTLGGNGHPAHGSSAANPYVDTGSASASRRGYTVKGPAARSVPRTSSKGMTFITDTLAPGGGPATPVVTIPDASAFSWSDAGVGAGAATGALVALLGATLVLGRRRNERLAI
ncbi:MAG TPA: hypothetical protein VGH92_09360 [Gaiellaceae bacterium]